MANRNKREKKETHRLQSKTFTAGSWIDRLGMLLASVCLIHCWLLPLSLALLPIMHVEEEWVHPFFTATALTASLFLLFRSEFIRRSAVLTLLLATGNLCLVLAAWWGKEWLSPPAEIVLNTAGSISLLTVHYKSFHLHKRRQQACCRF